VGRDSLLKTENPHRGFSFTLNDRMMMMMMMMMAAANWGDQQLNTDSR
jgi:hypothetical protein